MVAKDLDADYAEEMTRVDICSAIEHEMLLKEKYATDKKKNKYTYIRIPINHPNLPFPYNLEDRVRHVVTQIRNEVKFAINIKTSTIKKKAGPEKGMPSYVVSITNKPQLKEYSEFLKNLGGTETKAEWKIMVE